MIYLFPSKVMSPLPIALSFETDSIYEERAACSQGSGLSPGWPRAAPQQRCSSQSFRKEEVKQWGHVHAADAGQGSAPAVPESTGSSSVAVSWGS